MNLESLSRMFQWLDERVAATGSARREDPAAVVQQPELGDEWLSRYLFDRDSRQDEAVAPAR